MKQVLADTLSRLAEASGYHQRAPEHGDRAWRVKGRFADVIYWDAGNGWCDIIKVTPKSGQGAWLQQFFDAVEATHDA